MTQRLIYLLSNRIDFVDFLLKHNSLLRYKRFQRKETVAIYKRLTFSSFEREECSKASQHPIMRGKIRAFVAISSNRASRWTFTEVSRTPTRGTIPHDRMFQSVRSRPTAGGCAHGTRLSPPGIRFKYISVSLCEDKGLPPTAACRARRSPGTFRNSNGPKLELGIREL